MNSMEYINRKMRETIDSKFKEIINRLPQSSRINTFGKEDYTFY